MIVIWAPDPLLLTEIKRNEDGSLKAGNVINGGWRLELRNGELLAKAGNSVVSRWPAPNSIPEVEVPEGLHKPARQNYNQIIEWAEKELPNKPNKWAYYRYT